MRFARAIWRTAEGRIGVLVIAAVAVAAIFAPVLAPQGYVRLFPNFLPPLTDGHWLGTDGYGRDVFSYIVWGARLSLLFGCGAAVTSVAVGILVGAVPGYFGGWLDDVFSRLTDAFLVVPSFFLIIIVVAFFGAKMIYVMLVVGLTLWPSNARIVRAQIMKLKSREYVLAARSAGASHGRIIFLHILPNGLSPVVVNSTLQVAYAVLFEASLSFLGLGDPNHPSWGQLLYLARQNYTTAWWIGLYPGLAIMLFILGVNMFGDAINRAFGSALDPRTL